MATVTRQIPVRLRFSDGQVVVTPQDMDTFVISAGRATEACQEAVRREGWIQQFQQDFLVPVHAWCVRHAPPVRACYMPMPAGAIRLFVVTTAPRFDFELAAGIAGLERMLQRAGWRVTISQLPAAEDDSLGAFFTPDGALEVYAQSERAQDEGRP